MKSQMDQLLCLGKNNSFKTWFGQDCFSLLCCPGRIFNSVPLSLQSMQVQIIKDRIVLFLSI